MSEIEPPFKSKRTMLDRFIKRIRGGFQFFQAKPEKEGQLLGRIQDLHHTADDVIKQLKTIKSELKSQVDNDVFTFVEAVVDPMIQDATSIQKKVNQQSSSVTQQAQAFKRYSEWIEKAKIWVQICSKTSDPQGIAKAVIRLTIEDFLKVIDRDLQVIQDYTEHMIDSLPLDDIEKAALIDKIHTKLDPYIESLKALKASPEDLHFQQIQSWKLKVDKRREKYFDGALHAIDKIIEETSPMSSSNEEHEHLVDILNQINYLEEEVPLLCVEILNADLEDEFQKKVLESRMTACQRELHELNLDLRLTPELIDRLEILSELIKNTQDKLV